MQASEKVIVLAGEKRTKQRGINVDPGAVIVDIYNKNGSLKHFKTVIFTKEQYADKEFVKSVIETI